jgi:hypothetical protein
MAIAERVGQGELGQRYAKAARESAAKAVRKGKARQDSPGRVPWPSA